MKKSKLLGTFAISVLALAACGTTTEAPVPSVLDDGVLTVGVSIGEDRSWYTASDEDGEKSYAGWEVEVLKILDESLENVRVDYIYANSQSELLEMLNSGAVDIAAGSFTATDLYSGQYLLSNNYGYGSLYLVNNRNGYITTLAAYEDESVGIMGSIPAGVVSELTGISAVTQLNYTDIRQLADDVTNDVIAAGLCTERDATQLLSEGQLQVAELGGGPQVGLVFLMPAGQTALQSYVNAAISQHYDQLANPGSTQ